MPPLPLLFSIMATPPFLLVTVNTFTANTHSSFLPAERADNAKLNNANLQNASLSYSMLLLDLVSYISVSAEGIFAG